MTIFVSIAPSLRFNRWPKRNGGSKSLIVIYILFLRNPFFPSETLSFDPKTVFSTINVRESPPFGVKRGFCVAATQNHVTVHNLDLENNN